LTPRYGTASKNWWGRTTERRSRNSSRPIEKDTLGSGSSRAPCTPGIAELLDDLFDRDRVLIQATSKLTTYARSILENLELARLFDKKIGSELDGARSAKEEAIKLVKGAYGGPTSAYVMIGDRGDDIIGARRNGIDSIGVLYGYCTPSEVTESNPTFVARAVDDVREVLLA